MKRLISFLVISASIVGMCMAGSLQPVGPFILTNVGTNDVTRAKAATNNASVGFIEAIVFAPTNSAPSQATNLTVTVSVINETGITRQLYTGTVTEESTVFPQGTVVTAAGAVTTNAFTKIPITGGKVVVSAFNALAATNCNLKVWLIQSLP